MAKISQLIVVDGATDWDRKHGQRQWEIVCGQSLQWNKVIFPLCSFVQMSHQLGHSCPEFDSIMNILRHNTQQQDTKNKTQQKSVFSENYEPFRIYIPKQQQQHIFTNNNRGKPTM